MSDITKYAPINGNTLFSDFKTHFSIFRTQKRTTTIAYAFVFVFIAFTIFLAFTPNTTNSASPWFTNPFSISTDSEQSYRSNFYPIYNYFFPNSSQSHDSSHNAGSINTSVTPHDSNKDSPVLEKQSKTGELTHKAEVLNSNQTVNNNQNPPKPKPELRSDDKNQTQSLPLIGKVEVLEANQSIIGVANTSESANKTVNLPASGLKNVTADVQKVIAEKGAVKNLTSSETKKQDSVKKEKQGIDDLIKSLIGCDFFDGNWVRDESYPLYKPGSCSLIDEQFNCFRNGRPDNGYHKLKWKPKGCTLPRLDGSHMLELLRGKRLVFVGDSLNRNMWESLICILKNSVKDQKKVYEESGRHHFRSEASYSFVFEEYKCTVEFFVSPFLVQEWEAADKNGTKKETLRLDLISSYADRYKKADIIVFNTGHWWTHEKTSKGEDYYQEGSHVYKELNVLEAFRKAITTWGKWVDANVNPRKSLVFFRGYSASHFSGGQWNSGGQCDNETEPIKNDKYLSQYPPKMSVLEKVLKGMKTQVTYLNVTRMTDYRKDGHPSIYRKQHYSDEEKKTPLIFQDCSHWCLPGVPDAWNELLYAELLVKLSQKRQ